MQSTATCWEANLLTVFAGELVLHVSLPWLPVCCPLLWGGESFLQNAMRFFFSLYFSGLVLYILALLCHAFSSLVAPSSDGLVFAFGKMRDLLAAELIHFCGPITHSWLFFPVGVVEKNLLHWKQDQDLNHFLYS